MKIALFLGSDLTSHIIAARLIPALIGKGHMPLLYFTRPPRDVGREPELVDLFHIERHVLSRFVTPFCDAMPLDRQGRALSPSGIARRYAGLVKVRAVVDVNSKEFLHGLDREGAEVGFSVRCYQKFGRDIIRGFIAPGADGTRLANLHPGALPGYRGVFTFARAMLAGEAEAGFTLHRIDENWDAGEIMATSSARLDYGKSVLENMLDQVDDAAQLVLQAVTRIEIGLEWSSFPQSEERARYYSHLTREHLDALRGKGIRLAHNRRIIDRIVAEYTLPASPESFELKGILTGATASRSDRLPAPVSDRRTITHP
jgi:methionyl-tRNA formyltransferase